MNNIELAFKTLLYTNNIFQSNEFFIILDKNLNIGYLLVSTYDNKVKIIKHVTNIKNYFQLFKGLFENSNLFIKIKHKQNITFFAGAKKSPIIQLFNGHIIKTKNVFILKNKSLSELKPW